MGKAGDWELLGRLDRPQGRCDFCSQPHEVEQFRAMISLPRFGTLKALLSIGRFAETMLSQGQPVTIACLNVAAFAMSLLVTTTPTRAIH